MVNMKKLFVRIKLFVALSVLERTMPFLCRCRLIDWAYGYAGFFEAVIIGRNNICRWEAPCFCGKYFRGLTIDKADKVLIKRLVSMEWTKEDHEYFQNKMNRYEIAVLPNDGEE